MIHLLVLSWLVGATSTDPPRDRLPQERDAALARQVDVIVDEARSRGFAGGVAIVRGGHLVPAGTVRRAVPPAAVSTLKLDSTKYGASSANHMQS